MTTGIEKNQVGGYNILLSVDPLFVHTLSEKTNTSNSITNEVKSSRFSTMFQSTDGNFLELRHDLHPKKGKGLGSIINIKTFDPGLNFLNSLFFEFTQQALNTLVESKRAESEKITDLFTNMKEAKDTIDARRVALSEAEVNVKDHDSSWNSYLDDKEVLADFSLVAGLTWEDTPKWQMHQNKASFLEHTVEGIANNLEADEERYANLVAETQEILASKSLPKVWVMYGIGNDTNDWAGPFETYLGDIKHSNNGKNETVTYELVVDLVSDAIRERVEETFDKSNLFSKTGVIVKAYDRGDRGRWGSVPFLSSSESFHDVIVKLLSNYLYSLGIKNHIILLPHLDNVIRGVIEKAVIDNLEVPRRAPSLHSAVFDPAIVRPFTDKGGVYNSTTISNISSDLLNPKQPEFVHLAAGLHEIAPSIGMSDAKAYIKRGFYDKVLKAIFNSLNLKGTAANAPSDAGAPIIVEEVGSKFREHGPVSVDDPFDPLNRMGSVEGDKILSINFGPKYSEVEDVDDYTWTDPLKEIIKSLNSVAADNSIDYYGEFISDIKIKNIISNKFGGGTFAGYKVNYSADRGTLAHAIDDEPYFIFGDRNLVRLLLFGDIDRLRQSDPDDYANEDYLAEVGGLPSFNVLGSPRLQDPIWNILKDDIASMVAGGNTYFKETYRKLHLPGGYNLGYYLKIVNDTEDLGLQLPDEFALTKSDPDSDALLKYVYDTAFPLFLANTDNANVLSYNFDVGKFLYSQIFGSIREVFSTVAKRYYTRGNPIIDSETTKEEVAQKMVEVLDNIASRSAGLGSRLSTTFGSPTKIDIDAMADDLADLLLLETVGISRTTRRGKGSSVIGFVNLFLDLFSQAYKGTIRTLPMYHLSNQAHLLQQAMVILKAVKKINPNTVNSDDMNSITDFLSGAYRIIGFTHLIAPKQAYSEFTVQRDIKAELSNAED